MKALPLIRAVGSGSYNVVLSRTLLEFELVGIPLMMSSFPHVRGPDI